MAEIGISIYPSKSDLNEMKDYLSLAAEIGYKRVFTSMLEVAEEPWDTVALFKEIIHYGNDLGLKTSLDVNPELFKALDLSYDDLSFFADLGIWSLRLDLGFTGFEEALMTYNPYGILIELNVSRGQHYIDLVNDCHPNKRQLIGSHNFYPLAYTGLDYEFFLETASIYKQYQLLTAAFIDSPSGRFGPWPHDDMMVTAEVQRSMPIASQVNLLKQSGVIDDMIISSTFVAEADLRSAYEAFQDPLVSLIVELAPAISPLEKKIITEEIHQYRGDKSAYMIRSSHPRVKYREEAIAPVNVSNIKAGDVTIGNNDAGQYKGELHIALLDRPNAGNQNVVARVADHDLPILDLLQPWQSFRLVSKS